MAYEAWINPYAGTLNTSVLSELDDDYNQLYEVRS